MELNKMECTSLPGANVFYIEDGAGPDLILLHGFPTSSYIWRNTISHLATRFRVIAPDFIGYGKSDKPLDKEVSLLTQANMVVDLMDQLNIDKAIICGHDMGGGVAQIIATGHEDRVNKLVLLDTVCYDSWPIQPFAEFKERELRETLTPADLEFRLKALLPSGFYDIAKLTPEIMANYLEPWMTTDGVKAFLHNVENFDSRYTMVLVEELKTTRVPTLLIWGEGDSFQKIDYAYRLQADIPDCRLEIIPNARHFVMEDNPEQVSSLIMDFGLQDLLAA